MVRRRVGIRDGVRAGAEVPAFEVVRQGASDGQSVTVTSSRTGPKLPCRYALPIALAMASLLFGPKVLRSGLLITPSFPSPRTLRACWLSGLAKQTTDPATGSVQEAVQLRPFADLRPPLASRRRQLSHR